MSLMLPVINFIRMKILFYRSVLVLMVVLFFFSCKKDTLTKNITPVHQDSINYGPIAYQIQEMEENLFYLTGSWQYQLQENLNADVFAGYCMPPNSFGSVPGQDGYSWKNGWNDYIYTVAQGNLNALENVSTAASSNNAYSSYYAVGRILKVMVYLPLIDAFGPIPYFNYGQNNAAFDNLDVIYKKGMVNDLIAARDSIESSYASGKWSSVANYNGDISSFAGTAADWVKLANTLLLRIAIRMDNVASTTADSIIRLALADKNGFVDASTGDWTIDCISGNPYNCINPFSFLSTAWNNCSMSADMWSFLTGFQDPRIASYFVPVTYSNADSSNVTQPTPYGTYKAVRPGTNLSTPYTGVSNLVVSRYWKLMSSAESYFLLAEAALKGLGGLHSSQAQGYYESGVTQSFSSLGLNASTYLQSVLTPANFVDFINSGNNYTATTAITPKWDASGTTNLEQILTQKWIALFPRGEESWAEFRRTGFPKLMLPFNMVTAASAGGDVPQGHFATKLPYPDLIYSVMPSQYNAAVSAYMNGVDNGSTLLWFETNQVTFPENK